jgi:hypothetical protein
LIFKPQFLVWGISTLLVILLLAWVSLVGLLPIWLAALAMTLAVVTLVLRWARYFLVRLIVDYDARNGDGVVMIERLIPAPNLPESVQLSLQDAAEGPTAVNVSGLFNTLITILEPLKFLRVLTVGDITFRTRSGEFSMTMFSIQNPEFVKARIQENWRKIAAYKNKLKAEADRKEEIERMTIAVAQGLKRAQDEFKLQLVVPVPAPGPEPPENVKKDEDEQAEK